MDSNFARIRLIALAALILPGVHADQRPAASPWVPYVTAVGAHGRFVLRDGSLVDLNTGSRIAARFSSSEREIVVSQGEALFTVVDHASWPLSVRVDGMTIHAGDSRFSVRMREGGRADVMVIDGHASIDSGSVSTRVDPGELVSLKFNYVIERMPLSAEAMSRRAAWVEGWLWFVEEPLPEAIAEFNRYHRGRLVLVDPALERVRIGGRFRSSDLDSFIATLEHSFDIRARPVHGTDTIYLSDRCTNTARHCN